MLASVPAADRGTTALALWSSFASGLNDLLYMAALALVGGVCAVLLIRRKDFVKRDSGAPGAVSALDSAAPASARR